MEREHRLSYQPDSAVSPVTRYADLAVRPCPVCTHDDTTCVSVCARVCARVCVCVCVCADARTHPLLKSQLLKLLLVVAMTLHVKPCCPILHNCDLAQMQGIRLLGDNVL